MNSDNITNNNYTNGTRTNGSSNAGNTGSSSTAGTSGTSGVHGSMERTAAVLRAMLQSSVKQLDVTHLGDQIRKHPTGFILAGSGILLAAAGCITLGVLEYQKRNTVSYKMKKVFGDFLSRF